MLGGDGDDRLEGGDGADDQRGGAGFDTVDYSNRTDALTIRVDDVAGHTTVTVAGLPRTRRGLPDDELLDIGRALSPDPDVPDHDLHHDDTRGPHRA